MGLTNDPAKWLVVALLICLHVTVLIWRRSKEPFAWKNMVPGLMTMVVAGWCCLCSAIDSEVPQTWVVGLVMGCGLLLSGRETTNNGRIGLTLFGMTIAFFITIVAGQLSGLPEYTRSETYWGDRGAWRGESGLPDLDYDDSTHRYPAAYSDSKVFGTAAATYPGRFLVISPKRLWHSPITGIYARTEQACRVWIPGGSASECLDGALLVPAGTPPGQERATGIPFDSIHYQDPYN